MNERTLNAESPAWHIKYLEDRENAAVSGEDMFISVDEFETE